MYIGEQYTIILPLLKFCDNLRNLLFKFLGCWIFPFMICWLLSICTNFKHLNKAVQGWEIGWVKNIL